MTNTAEKIIDKAEKQKQKIAKLYNVPTSAIIWKGINKFVIVKNGNTINIDSDNE